jgi:hypothetical protein
MHAQRWIAALGFLAVGCVVTGRYDPRLFAPVEVAPEKRLDGQALVLTAPEEDAYQFSGKPTSFAGSGVTLTMPLGLQTREAARGVFDALFRGGARVSSAEPALEAYRVVVSPRVTRLVHRYTMTHGVELELWVRVVARAGPGELLFDRTYASGLFALEDSRPAEVNLAYGVDYVLQRVLLRVAVDVRTCLVGPACPEPAPPPGPVQAIPPRRASGG